MTKTNGFFYFNAWSNKPSILNCGGYNALQAVIPVSLQVGLCNFLRGSLVGVDVRLNTKSCLLGVVELSLNVTHVVQLDKWMPTPRQDKSSSPINFLCFYTMNHLLSWIFNKFGEGSPTVGLKWVFWHCSSKKFKPISSPLKNLVLDVFGEKFQVYIY